MNTQDLNLLIQDYRERYGHHQQVYEFYAGLPSYQQAVEYAGWAKRPDGKRNPHQYRIKHVVLSEMHDWLLHQETMLRSLRSFQELIDVIRHNRIAGFGELSIYDTAIRLGAWLKLEPERVYLHAGTRTGVTKLGLNAHRESIDIHELPEPLQALCARDLEDFLCIYKEHLAPYEPDDDTNESIDLPTKRPC